MKSVRSRDRLSLRQTDDNEKNISSQFCLLFSLFNPRTFLVLPFFPLLLHRFILLVRAARKAVLILWLRRRIGTMLRWLSEVVCRPIRKMACLYSIPSLTMSSTSIKLTVKIKGFRNILLYDSETTVKRMRVNKYVSQRLAADAVQPRDRIFKHFN